MPPINPYMEILPEELLVDIFSRLPVNTVIHCKCVCKKWRSLVNNSYFINLHLSRSPVGFMENILDNDTSGILKWVEIEDRLDHHCLHHYPVINFDLNGYLAAPIPSTKLIPVRSVNGLICVSQCGEVGVEVDNIYICNPITRECLTLPRPQNYRYYFGFVYYNFGVNSLTGEYKVLRIFERRLLPAGRKVSDVEVYTLGKSQWRSLAQVPYQFGQYPGPFLNGNFHWKVYDLDAPESIITFDLDKETFQLFPSPPNERESEWSKNLGVFKGCLCESYTCNSRFTIWVMKQHAIKESWHKELVITHAIFAGLNWGFIFFAFLVLHDGTILAVLGNKMVAYCSKSKTIEDLATFDRQSVAILLTHHLSFIKLQDIDSERVHTF